MSDLKKQLKQLGHLDCAIIGGGMSGLYTGWRLRQERPDKKVAVFEMSDRVGGRLLTWLPYKEAGGLRAELGGMRFLEEQQMVWNLIGELGLQKTKFFVDGPNLLWYLRGESMAQGDVKAAALKYALQPQEQGKSPGDLIEGVIKEVLGTVENQQVIQKHLEKPAPESREDWDKIKPYLTFKGNPLWNLGFWNLLSDILSSEAYSYVTDAFGYYSITSNWNAAEAMQTVSLDFAQNTPYMTLVDGYSKLPQTLAENFEQLDGHILLNCSLLRFEANDNGTFTLFFKDGDGEAVATAERLVLAMPRRSLELLQPSRTFNPEGNSRLQFLINSVEGYPAFKLFMLYEKRWWEEARGIEHGRSVCDLPIRQTYYFRPDASEQGLPGVNPEVGLLMASYDDARAVGYWKGLEEPAAEKKQLRDELRKMLKAMPNNAALGSTLNFDAPPALNVAPPAMLAHAKEQLALLHGMKVEDIPDPLVGAYADWSHDPYGGGWNFWQPQVDVESVMKHIKTPLGHNLQVYLVGDAYSGMQGWVEGALTTAELVLQKGFKLDRPTWLPKEYYLGW